MAKVGYVGNTPNSSSVIIARQIYNVSASVGLVTFTSTYQPGYVDVYLNGVRLVDVVDYSAADGTHINLSTDAVVGDVIEAVSYKAFNVTDKRIGISSDGILIGTVDALNFVGAGHTFVTNGSSINCSITGPQGIPGVGRTWATYDGLTGVTTSKKVRIQNNLEVTGIATAGVLFSGNLTGTAVTATTFVGALTGNVTGNADTATNASGLTGTPNITVGSVTGTTGSFSGNVTIGGVLTYEDVTNIDAIGIITARSGVSIGDSIFHTGDSNTAIRFPAADTFTVETGGSERVRVDSSGRLLVGAFSALTGSDSQYSFVQNIGNSFGSTTPAYMSLGRSEVVTSMSNNDPVGRIFFTDNAAATFAYIEAAVDNTPGTNDYPGRLTFLTTPDGSATPTERLRITSAGRFGFHTTTPDAEVHIEPVSTNASIILSNDGRTQYFRIQNNETDDALVFNANDTNERLRISSSGSIGVGEADPSPHGGEYRGIDVGYKGSGITGRTGNPTFTMRSNIYYDGSNWKYGEGSTTAGVLSIGGAQLIFESAASGTAGATATLTERFRIDSSGNSTFTGTVSDSIGDLRMLGNNTQSAGSSYTLVLSDSGKSINKANGGGVTVPQGVFTTGHMVTVINASGSDFTITQGSSFTLYNTSDGTTGNRTLGGRGIATIFFLDTNIGYISGAGLS